MSCTSTYKSFMLAACPDAIVVMNALPREKTVTWRLKNKFGTVYTGQNVTNDESLLIIPIDGENNALRPDMFMEFSGHWELRCELFDDDGNLLPFIFCGTYDFAVLEFERVVEVPDPNEVLLDFDCPFEEEGGGL